MHVLEGFYSVHVKIRYLHDKTYQKGPRWYKKWSDKPYSSSVHKGTLLVVAISVISLQLIQSLWPYFNIAKPRPVMAGANTKTWTAANSDFLDPVINDGKINATITNATLGNSVDLGQGEDGPLTIAGSYNINSDNVSGAKNTAAGKINGRTNADAVATTSSAAVTVGATTITVASNAGFSVGDEIFIAKFWQASATATGKSEFKKITSITGTTTPYTLTLNSSLANAYETGSLIQRVPHYSNITVNSGGIITANSWNGTIGGVVLFKTSGTLTINSGGKISGSSLGYGADSGPGKGLVQAANVNLDAGYGGGGYGAAGGLGGNTTSSGGASYASFPDFGSGGATNAIPTPNASGGPGGGHVGIYVNTFNNMGTVEANGANGASTTGGSGGGGGAGGAVYLYATSITKGTINANGGSGGNGSDGGFGAGGGGGAGGRIKIEAAADPGLSGTSATGGGGGSGDSGCNGGSGGTPNPVYQFTAAMPYLTQGLLGTNGATYRGLQYNSGAGIKSNWATLKFNGTIPAGTSVGFKVRAGATLGSNDAAGTNGFVNPNDMTATWATTSDPATVINFKADFVATQTIEIILQFNGGAATPTLTSLDMTYNALEAPTNSNIILYRSDGATTLKTNAGVDISAGGGGGFTNEVLVKITTTGLTCTGCGSSTNRKIQAQAALTTDTAFATPISSIDANTTSSTVDAGVNFTSTATLTGLAPGSAYHLRARTIDNEGRVSGWTNYAADALAFSVEQTAPTISTYTINDNSSYVFANSRVLKASGIFNDAGGSSGPLMIQFSQDGLNWGTYSGSGTVNNKTTDWTNHKSITASSASQDITGAWYLEGADGTGLKVYARIKDNAGNTSGQWLWTTDADFTGGTQTTASNGSLTLASTGSGYYASGDLISPSPTTGASNYGKLSWGANIPVETGANALRFQIASIVPPNTTTGFTGPDGTQNTYYTTSGTQINSAHNGNSGLKFRALLQTANTAFTPTVYDVLVERSTMNPSQTVALDTAPPAAFNLTGPATNTWQNLATPTLSWSASSDSGAGLAKYQIFVDDVLNTDNIASSATSAALATPIAAQGMHTWQVKAFDNAGNITVSSQTWNIGFDNAAPGAISGLSASQNDPVNINVSWTAYSDGNSPVTNYQIQRVKKTEYDSNLLTPTGSWSAASSFTTITCGVATAISEDNTGVKSPLGCSLSGQLISNAFSYAYRVQAKDSANPLVWGAWTVNYAIGLNADTTAPTDPTVPGITPNASGYANRVTWNPSSDTGSGLSKYKIWRRAETNSTIAVNKITGADLTNAASQIWTLIGILPYVSGQTTAWDDNDANNDAIMLDKTVASPRLNDYVHYYYRITAVDVAGNHSEIIPTDNLGFVLNTNFIEGTTVDVTPPLPASTVTATPMGTDGVNVEPNNQQMDISWGAATDARTPGRVPAGAGSGVATYKIYRAPGNVSGPTGPFAEIASRTAAQGLIYSDKGLTEDSYYYYKVLAIDTAGNPATNQTNFLSAASQPAQTKNSAVPTTPTQIQAQAIKGNPNTDATVGKQIVFSFNGSAIKYAVNSITGYEIYRSTTNYPDDASWLLAQKVYTISNLNLPGYQSTISYDIRRQFTDTGLTDATTYYYRVRALANNSTSGPVQSGLSAVSVGTQNAGWDTTPDITPPMLPIELKVKDIHDDGVSYKRNIITWKRVDNPSRGGVNDFKEYRLYRSNDGVTWSQICRNSLVSSCTADNPNPLYSSDQNLALATNYYIDLVPISQANQSYYYYVTSVDNAGTDFKYAGVPGTPIINTGYSNESKPLRDAGGLVVAVSLNPAIAQPSINTLAGGKKATLDAIGVSSATISWTTDQPCDSLVEYRKAGTSDKFIAAGDTELKISHTVILRALDPLTAYEYRLLSRNYLANTAKAEGNDVPALTTVGFTINPGSVLTTTSTAEINWTTNLDADSNFVEYQLQKQPGDTDFSSIAGDPTLSKNHYVIIKGLRSNRTYTYKIRSISLDKYVAETAFLTFRTRNFDSEQFTLTPSSSNVAERNITATTAQVVWQTSMPTTSWVDFSTTSGIYDMSAGNNDLNSSHAVTIDGLVPGTRYYYRVRVKDANEVEYTSQEYTFTAVLKPKISNLRISDVTSYSVTINWETNVETETLINWGKTAAYGEKRGIPERTKNHSLKIADLEDNTEYHYQILARDQVGNEVADDDKVIRTPLDVAGPKISDMKTDILPLNENDNTASVIISWKTDKPATRLLQYDEGIIGGRYNKSTIEDTSLSTSHTVIVKDLDPGKTYHYRIVAKDKRGNQTISNDYNFITPTIEKSILQLIIKSLEESFSWVRNVGKFFTGLGKKTK